MKNQTEWADGSFSEFTETPGTHRRNVQLRYALSVRRDMPPFLGGVFSLLARLRPKRWRSCQRA